MTVSSRGGVTRGGGEGKQTAVSVVKIFLSVVSLEEGIGRKLEIASYSSTFSAIFGKGTSRRSVSGYFLMF